jgi:large subunit ribosomal protein L4
VVLDDLSFEAAKTKQFKAFMTTFDLPDALVVLESSNENVELAARNLQNVTVMPPIGVNVYDVLRRGRLVMTRSAVEALSARLGGK